MSNVPRLYIAGPWGFSEASRYFYYRKLIPKLKRLGYQILDPWRLTDRRKVERASKMRFGPKKRNMWRSLNREIGRNNLLAIDRCDGIFAILDGTDVDSGTAS